jgi:hypothetical protein
MRLFSLQPPARSGLCVCAGTAAGMRRPSTPSCAVPARHPAQHALPRPCLCHSTVVTLSPTPSPSMIKSSCRNGLVPRAFSTAAQACVYVLPICCERPCKPLVLRLSPATANLVPTVRTSLLIAAAASGSRVPRLCLCLQLGCCRCCCYCYCCGRCYCSLHSCWRARGACNARMSCNEPHAI